MSGREDVQSAYAVYDPAQDHVYLDTVRSTRRAAIVAWLGEERAGVWPEMRHRYGLQTVRIAITVVPIARPARDGAR